MKKINKKNKIKNKPEPIVFSKRPFYEDGSVEQAYHDNVVSPAIERSNWLQSEARIANSD